ncbi:AlpA family phage regulatory protein [Klebsiella pneumoniae]
MRDLILQLSKSSIYSTKPLISQNRFPQPVKIGVRATAFVESEIDEWIQLIIENSRKHVA